MGLLDQLLALFRLAEALVEKELARATARGAQSTARQRSQRLAEIRAILAELSRQAIGTEQTPGLAWQVVREGYGRGRSEALRGRGDDGGGPVGVGLGAVDLRLLRTLYDGLAEQLAGAIDHANRHANRQVRSVVLGELLVGAAAGRSRGDTAAAVGEDLRSRGVSGLLDKSGRSWRLSTYAETVTAWEAAKANTTGALQRLAENGIDLAVVSDHASACDVCKRYEGRIYSISGTHPEYPALTVAPPYHHRCRHVITAYVEGLAA